MSASGEHERERLELVNEIQILQSETAESFDSLTAMAASVCAQPMAAVSLVDESRQTFISRHALGLSETSREAAFCAHAIEACSNAEVFEVADTYLDPRFRNNDLVIGEPHLRFYAGVPLVPIHDQPIGALCVLGTKPAELTLSQRRDLTDLARIAEQLIRLQLLTFAKRELLERVEASEEQLRESSDRRAHAGRSIAHDLATPLAAIRITSESLGMQDLPARFAGHIDKLVEYSRDAESLVRDLRVVNSEDGNDIPLLLARDQPIAPLVERSVMQLFGSLHSDLIRLDLDDIEASVDEHAFHRIVTNLLTNAIGHNVPGTNVSVRLSLGDDAVILEVSDDGIGIPVEDRSRMLKPYEAINTTGSGLGLAIIDSLVEAHGGSISIGGNSPSGTIITITLPTQTAIGV